MRTILCVAVAALAAATTLAHASNYAFRLHNRAQNYTINGFYTYQEGQWSDNWLKDGARIRPGDIVEMDWFSNKGDCVVPFRVSWDNYGADDFKVDWCQHPKNIYMENKGFSWD
ncbi:hypothetical protein [Rhizobium sp. C4]|uniref:hypothetical protein n=1 Tax=Rhizobium sp. C4 TaxID=1349800 RepID=UPI001E3340C5|nr:hypothetical protein [Rhizobium sp. C4]MCD2171943.1 hypothetical protein [Rhizobium sp. C4]